MKIPRQNYLFDFEGFKSYMKQYENRQMTLNLLVKLFWLVLKMEEKVLA